MQPVHDRTFATAASSTGARPRVVILGSGWGGYQVLRGVDKTRYDVTVVSPSSYFNFSPLLASCAVGTLEHRCAIEPVRRYSPSANFYEAWCDNIDFKTKTLRCTPSTPEPVFADAKSSTKGNIPQHQSFQLQYDKLIVAVGAYSQTFGTPGVKENAHFLKDIRDARAIRTRLIECFEQASQPTIDEATRRSILTFCIVGGGPTGIEFCANLHDFLRTHAARHYPQLAPLVRVKLYDVAPNILSSFDTTIVAYAERTLRRENIEINTDHHIEKVEPGVLHVKEQGKVPFGLLVWSTGIAPHPLLQAMSPDAVAKHEKTGSLLTDSKLHLMRKDGDKGAVPDEDVWAIGDAAVAEGAFLPATAQVASQKAKYVVKELNRGPTGKAFKFRYFGTMTNLGESRAVFDRSSADSGPRVKEGGVLAWLLWHSAYVTMTLSWRNKFLVLIHWLLNRVFGRDLSRF